MTLEKKSPCKINLLLNILGRRADGFHELETVMLPVNLFDELSFAREPEGIRLSCSEPSLSTGAGNLVYRAAEQFLRAAKVNEGVRIHLRKRIPLAAGLGGGSGNAATTLLGLNALYGAPLSPPQLVEIAARLGSDVPFFLQPGPALATGRGEQVRTLDAFPALRGAGLLLVHPGFGISTVWAYQALGRFPAALNGRPGRAHKLIARLQSADLEAAIADFYNSLEAPALEKFPLLTLFQEFLRANGAIGVLMSGSGSTTFAVARTPAAAEQLAEKFKGKFGRTVWTAVVPM